MTDKERLLSLKGNLKNFTWDVIKYYRLEREDLFVLSEILKDSEYIKNNKTLSTLYDDIVKCIDDETCYQYQIDSTCGNELIKAISDYLGN